MSANTTVFIRQYILFVWSSNMLQPVSGHLQALNLKKQTVEDNIQLIVTHSYNYWKWVEQSKSMQNRVILNRIKQNNIC